MWKNTCVYLLCVCIASALVFSCIDEPFVAKPESTFIQISVADVSKTENRATIPGGLDEKPGETPDNIVRKLRVMIFEETNDVSGAVLAGPTGNSLYSILNTSMDVVKHPVNLGGKYTMVFIANEPSDSYFQSISNFNDLKGIAFPADAFDSDKLIPMMQVVKGVDILAGGVAELKNGTFTDINGNTRVVDPTKGLYAANAKTSTLILRLDRLAVRVNVKLQSELDLSGSFKNVILSKMPDKVPLFRDYTGTINRNISRTIPVSKFTSVTPPSGYAWMVETERIVMPSNHADVDTEATVLTVDLDTDMYSPSCNLQIQPNNYNLHYNTWLDFIGIVKEPLELNVVASDWSEVDEEWDIAGIRKLNVSNIDVSITDFNGVRISFWSNMPSVRVLPEVYRVEGGSETVDVTNLVFNDLAMTPQNDNKPSRFYYDPGSGSGYMDILVDSLNTVNGQWVYKLYLVAENADGTNQLRREIKVNVKQYGTRYKFDHYSISGYVGSFFRKEEKGERIITGQALNGLIYHNKWVAKTDDDWIILSSTPSFDPEVGTNNPGDPEKYEVRPNTLKYDADYSDGKRVSGRGRIYFRVGVKETIPNEPNRYGVIKLSYLQKGSDGVTWQPEIDLYVRQGEDADFVFSDNDNATVKIGDDIILNNQPRVGARKFSPYNLTADGLDASSDYVQLPVRSATTGGGAFVQYPTQGGAFFQWSGGQEDDKPRRAFHPAREANFGVHIPTFNFWDQLKATNETCPPGYSRPNDGSVKRPVTNGLSYNKTLSKYEKIDKDSLAYSTFRMSLFRDPEAGDGFRHPTGPVLTPPTPLESWQSYTEYFPSFPSSKYVNATSTYNSETKQGGPIGHQEGLEKTSSGGFYADGFFDRRPIDDTFKSVSSNNANIAYTGVLFFNQITKKSLFFPATGRLNGDGKLESRGIAGYYWSSSASYSRVESPVPAWCFELAYYYISPVSTSKGFGSAIRCVEGDSSTY